MFFKFDLSETMLIFTPLPLFIHFTTFKLLSETGNTSQTQSCKEFKPTAVFMKELSSLLLLPWMNTGANGCPVIIWYFIERL